MNGTTEIDAALNPSMAAMDQHTYGLRWCNFTTFGSRWLKVSIWRITFDFYWGGVNRGGYWRIGNAGVLFTPIGSITWPLSNIRR